MAESKSSKRIIILIPPSEGKVEEGKFECLNEFDTITGELLEKLKSSQMNQTKKDSSKKSPVKKTNGRSSSKSKGNSKKS